MYKLGVTITCMDIKALEARKGSRKQLQVAERNVLIAKMIDILCEGYVSSGYIAKQLRVNRATVENYRPLADELIAKMRLDTNVIRNLQIKRTYQLIEQLMIDLKASGGPNNVKDRALIYASIYKFSSHLALITGLNVETHVTVDPTKLVIIRSNQRKKVDQVDETPQAEVSGDLPLLTSSDTPQ